LQKPLPDGRGSATVDSVDPRDLLSRAREQAIYCPPSPLPSKISFPFK
jgi:hypothetical protein